MLMSTRLAKIVSDVTSPLVVFPGAIVYFSSVLIEPLSRAVLIAVITLAIVELPVLTFILIQVKRGVFSDIHVKEREKRFVVYLIFLVSVLVSIPILRLLLAPTLLVTLLIAGFLVNSANIMINTVTKISAHTSNIAIMSVVLWVLYGNVGALVGIALVLVVSWARLVVKAHTLPQVALGILVGGLTTFLTIIY